MKMTRTMLRRAVISVCAALTVLVGVGANPYTVYADESANLNDFTTEIKINNSTESPQELVAGKTYPLKITFSEVNGGKQFSNDSALEYTFPDGVNVPLIASKKMDVSVTTPTGTFTLTDNEFSITEEGGVKKLTFNFNRDDTSPAWQALKDCGNTVLEFDLSATFTPPSSDPIDFGNGHTITIDANKPGTPSIEKNGSYDSTSHEITYSVKITTDGNSTGIKLTDTLIGSNISFVDDGAGHLAGVTLKKYKSSDNTEIGSETPTISVSSNTDGKPCFEYPAAADTGLALNDGEYYILSYKTKVTIDSRLGTNSYDATKNTVSMNYTGGNPDEPKTADYGKTGIAYAPLEKDVDGGTDLGNNKTEYTWTVTYNKNCVESMVGHTLTDTVSSSANTVMTTIEGYGLKVEAYDSATATTPAATWTPALDDVKTSNSKGWTYTIPQSTSADEKLKYVITYKTVTDVTEIAKAHSITNTVKDNLDFSATKKITGINPPGGGTLDVIKDIDIDTNGEDKDSLSWTITIKVPNRDLSGTVKVTDTLPSRTDGTSTLIDTLQQSTVTVTGLQSNEGYVLTPAADGKSFVIEFKYSDTDPYASAAATDIHSGLKGITTDTNTVRTITVTYDTLKNTDWLSKYPTENHKNTAKLQVYNDTDEDSATARPRSDSIKKTTVAGTFNVSEGGITLPAYKFEIVTSGVNAEGSEDSKVINAIDEFNTTYFKIYPTSGTAFADNGKVEGRNDGGAYTTLSDKAIFTDTATGATISATNLTYDTNKYYEEYKITYYLVVKDADTLIKMKQDAANASGAKLEFTNKVVWNGIDTSSVFSYTYDGLIKKVLNKADLTTGGRDNLAHYEITVNPGATKINGGAKFNVVDTFNKLRIDYRTIKVMDGETDLAKIGTVYYNATGDTLTFYDIPDAKKIVITYDAYISANDAKNIANIGTTYESGREEPNFNINFSATGGGTLYGITILKCQKGKTSTTLEGAQFKLYDATGDKVLKYTSGEEVVFTTGADGTIKVLPTASANNYVLDKDHKYYVVEIKAPNGYILDPTHYEFTLVEGKVPDYPNYKYVNNDILKINNTRAITIGKKAFRDTDELAGAELAIKSYADSTYSGTPVDITSWTTTYTAKTFEFTTDEFSSDTKLQAGYYELVEMNAPDTYDISDPVRFRVKDTGDLEIISGDGELEPVSNTLTMRDYHIPSNINISKIELSNGAEKALPGATLSIYEGEFTEGKPTGTPIDTWVSTADKHSVTGSKFKRNKSYTLYESAAPEGYDVAANIVFTIDKIGNIDTISSNAYKTSNKVDRMIVMLDTLKKVTPTPSPNPTGTPTPTVTPTPKPTNKPTPTHSPSVTPGPTDPNGGDVSPTSIPVYPIQPTKIPVEDNTWYKVTGKKDGFPIITYKTLPAGYYLEDRGDGYSWVKGPNGMVLGVRRNRTGIETGDKAPIIPLSIALGLLLAGFVALLVLRFRKTES